LICAENVEEIKLVCRRIAWSYFQAQYTTHNYVLVYCSDSV